jgi:phage terminase Nu1 subunit (DNA packaging protein)
MSNTVEAAQHIDLSERRFRELLDTGAIARKPRDEYDLGVVRRSYIRHLRKEAAGHGGSDLAGARAKLARVQTEAMQLKTDIANGKFVEVASVGRILTTELLSFRENFLGLPGVMADVICTLCGGDVQLRGRIEIALRDAVHELLQTISSAAEISLRADREYQSWRGRR